MTATTQMSHWYPTWPWRTRDSGLNWAPPKRILTSHMVRKIFIFPDSPHVLKRSWGIISRTRDLQPILEFNKTQEMYVAPKLKTIHLDCKGQERRVRLVAEVFALSDGVLFQPQSQRLFSKLSRTMPDTHPRYSSRTIRVPKSRLPTIGTGRYQCWIRPIKAARIGTGRVSNTSTFESAGHYICKFKLWAKRHRSITPRQCSKVFRLQLCKRLPGRRYLYKSLRRTLGLRVRRNSTTFGCTGH